MKQVIIALIVVIFIGAVAYFGNQWLDNKGGTQDQNGGANATTTEDGQQNGDTTMDGEEANGGTATIGTSVEGRSITAHTYGNGDTQLLFVGGIHGGYEWNTVLVAYELMDYLDTNPEVVPENVKVTVIPVLNPDGLNKTVGTDGRFALTDVPQVEGATVAGRFNANGVDLNRNFDCDWESTGMWRNTPVDAGSAAFSEPESTALKNYIESRRPAAVVVWYSAAGGVFASSCHSGVLTETRALTNLYASASGYPAYEEFDFYEITGDMVNWLAKEEIPAISVLLTTHTNVEWDKNKAGIDALLQRYAE
jgi:hypothetical protein